MLCQRQRLLGLQVRCSPEARSQPADSRENPCLPRMQLADAVLHSVLLPTRTATHRGTKLRHAPDMETRIISWPQVRGCSASAKTLFKRAFRSCCETEHVLKDCFGTCADSRLRYFYKDQLVTSASQGAKLPTSCVQKAGVQSAFRLACIRACLLITADL